MQMPETVRLHVSGKSIMAICALANMVNLATLKPLMKYCVQRML